MQTRTHIRTHIRTHTHTHTHTHDYELTACDQGSRILIDFHIIPTIQLMAKRKEKNRNHKSEKIQAMNVNKVLVAIQIPSKQKHQKKMSK